jgi:hypothetical protein
MKWAAAGGALSIAAAVVLLRKPDP